MELTEQPIYVLIGEEVRGPMTLREARKAIDFGRIPKTALFARDGDENWTSVGVIKGLEFAHQKAPSPAKERALSVDFVRVLWVVAVLLFIVMAYDHEVIPVVFGIFGIILGLALAVYLYCLPMILAKRRDHRNYVALAALNILLGWTFLFWVLALVWALYKAPGEPTQKPVKELTPAAKLRPSGSAAAEGLSMVEIEVAKSRYFWDSY